MPGHRHRHAPYPSAPERMTARTPATGEVLRHRDGVRVRWRNTAPMRRVTDAQMRRGETADVLPGSVHGGSRLSFRIVKDGLYADADQAQDAL